LISTVKQYKEYIDVIAIENPSQKFLEGLGLKTVPNLVILTKHPSSPDQYILFTNIKGSSAFL